MTRPHIPDPEDDFDGCIAALVKEATAEHEKIPQAERPLYYLGRAASHLARVIELRAPDIIIRMAMNRMEDRINGLRDKYPRLASDEPAGEG